MRDFLERYLDPADRLGEILFGLIMALGFTGAVRLGHEEADSRALFIGIFGCNLACAIVDGVDPNLAVRLSHLIALTLLFLLGAWWGRVVGARPFRIAAGLTLVGTALVLVTIALGG